MMKELCARSREFQRIGLSLQQTRRKIREGFLTFLEELNVEWLIIVVKNDSTRATPVS